VKSYGLEARYEDDDFSQVDNLGGILFVKNQSYDYCFIPADRLYANASEYQSKVKAVYDLVEDEAQIRYTIKDTYTKPEPRRQQKRSSRDLDRSIINAADFFSRTRIPNLSIEVRVEEPVCPLNYLKDRSEIYSVEKVTIFENFVKIGFNTYDIWVDLCGNEFIIHPEVGKLYVKKDRYGRQYLAA
jgi:hypothetical protein